MGDIFQFSSDDDQALSQWQEFLSMQGEFSNQPHATPEDYATNRETYVRGIIAWGSKEIGTFGTDYDDLYSDAGDYLNNNKTNAVTLLGEGGDMFALLALSYGGQIKGHNYDGIDGDDNREITGSARDILVSVARGDANALQMSQFLMVAFDGWVDRWGNDTKWMNDNLRAGKSRNDSHAVEAVTWAMENLEFNPGQARYLISTLLANGVTNADTIEQAIAGVDDPEKQAVFRLALTARELEKPIVEGYTNTSGAIPDNVLNGVTADFGLSADEIVAAFTAGEGTPDQAALNAQLSTLVEELPADIVETLMARTEDPRIDASALPAGTRSFIDALNTARGITDGNASTQIGQLVSQVVALDDGETLSRNFKQIFEATPEAYRDDLLVGLFNEMGAARFQSFIRDHSGFDNTAPTHYFDSAVLPELQEAGSAITDERKKRDFETATANLGTFYDENPTGISTSTSTAGTPQDLSSLANSIIDLGFHAPGAGGGNDENPGGIAGGIQKSFSVFMEPLSKIFDSFNGPEREQTAAERAESERQELISDHPQADLIRLLEDNLGLKFDKAMLEGDITRTEFRELIEERLDFLRNSVNSDSAEYNLFVEMYDAYMRGDATLANGDPVDLSALLRQSKLLVDHEIVERVPVTSRGIGTAAELNTTTTTPEETAATLQTTVQTAINQALEQDFTSREVLESLINSGELADGTVIQVAGFTLTLGEGNTFTVTQGNKPVDASALWSALGTSTNYIALLMNMSVSHGGQTVTLRQEGENVQLGDVFLQPVANLAPSLVTQGLGA